MKLAKKEAAPKPAAKVSDLCLLICLEFNMINIIIRRAPPQLSRRRLLPPLLRRLRRPKRPKRPRSLRRPPRRLALLLPRRVSAGLKRTPLSLARRPLLYVLPSVARVQGLYTNFQAGSCRCRPTQGHR